MPGVNFAAVQAQVPMAQVLRLVGFVPRAIAGDQLHGPCPVHGSKSPRARCFSVHLGKGVCYCHKCGFAGNQIQLWAKLTAVGVYQAAIDLCRQAGMEVPWIERW